MRRFLSLGMLFVVFVAVAPVSAQLPASFNGANPRPITFTAINTTQMTKVMSLSNTMRRPAQQQAFSLANVFHGFTMPSWPPKVATPTVLPSSQNFPTTNNPYIVNR